MSWWHKGVPCEHDYEPVQYESTTDFDILKQLQRDGYPIVVGRTLIKMNESGEPLWSEHLFDLEMPGIRYESAIHRIYHVRVCLICGDVDNQVEERTKHWCDKICKAQQEVTERETKKQKRRRKAKELWEEYNDRNN